MEIYSIIKSTVAMLAIAIAIGSSTAQAGSGVVPKDYPLTKCPVSDEKLGEHGNPIKVNAPDGTDVYLCCKDCMKDFKKDPAKYSKMVEDAKSAAKK